MHMALYKLSCSHSTTSNVLDVLLESMFWVKLKFWNANTIKSLLFVAYGTFCKGYYLILCMEANEICLQFKIFLLCISYAFSSHVITNLALPLYTKRNQYFVKLIKSFRNLRASRI